ncbi:acylamino-acid-releasing enzyme [Hydra vulgaris]|uniref:acylamino-acid-releasing enzyme n=1 Tax=Hydra vulgaris TaxID=6087 RepID=UPI001F5FD5C9|nr:acylamino-acid-releasing enzyme-like [Hydra vulgaris]
MTDAGEMNIKSYVTASAKLFREAVLPTVSSASVTSVSLNKGKKKYLIETSWTQKCFDRNRSASFSFFYSFSDVNGIYKLKKSCSFPIRRESVLLEKISFSLNLKALIIKETNSVTKKDEFILEIWSNKSVNLIKSINLSACEKHGNVLSDSVFSSLDWSPDEDKIVYLAERKKPKCTTNMFETCSITKEEDSDKSICNKFNYEESWGEQMTEVIHPVICVADLLEGTINIVSNIPDNISPSQPQWGPGGTIIFEAIINYPFRLGIIYCSNRASYLCSVKYKCNEEPVFITKPSSYESNYCPRVSPCQTKLIYIHRNLSGKGDPHQGVEKLKVYFFNSQISSEIETEFPLYVYSLPKNCWLNSYSVIIPNLEQAESKAILINTETRKIIKKVNCSTILDVQQDIAILSHMTLDSTEANISVIYNSEHIETCQSTVNLKNQNFKAESFITGGLVSWSLSLKENTLPKPLIVWPHGGPHSVICNNYNHYAQVFCQLGYIVLLVNYSGSTSFSEKSLMSLPGNIGSQDIYDVHNIALNFISANQSIVDKENVYVFGGSHGGFIGAHLIAQYPDFYCAAALRNPVIEIASMSVTSDIPDWTYAVSGLSYNFSNVPNPEVYKVMLEKSPVILADKIKAPVLLCVGSKDARVPPTQSIHFFKLLKSLNKDVKMLMYPDDCHPLSNIETEGDVFLNVSLWFYQHKRKIRL